MNNLVKEICRILDFPETRWEKAVNEASGGKLNDCWLIVNDTLEYVESFAFDSGVVVVSTPKGAEVREVETLEVWNPETGLYTHDGVTLLLIKKAAKQWKKSFNPNHYVIQQIKGSSIIPWSDLYPFFVGQKPKQFLISDKLVYFYDKKIGAVKNGIVTVSDMYKQEVFDFIKREGLKCQMQL